ncbi:MAG: GyrI-like domain-containing protein [Gemmatimonadales bacterium]|jgi:hypothetical protein
MVTTKKIDLFKQHRDEYVARESPSLVTVKKARYLTIDGRGAPGGKPFQAAAGALYAMAYTIKMTRKFEGKGDHVVGKLEAQYRNAGSDVPMDQWEWRMLIRTPEVVGKRDVDAAVGKLRDKGTSDPVGDVHLEDFREGPCVQMLHVGPYDREHETIASMLRFAAAEGLEPHGLHHEIYLSDPRRVAPEKLRTILRMPVRRAGRGKKP